MAYSESEGKSVLELEVELREVFNNYPEYSDPARGNDAFMVMVNLFADDPFYKLHYVAKAFLALNKEIVDE